MEHIITWNIVKKRCSSKVSVVKRASKGLMIDLALYEDFKNLFYNSDEGKSNFVVV